MPTSQRLRARDDAGAIIRFADVLICTRLEATNAVAHVGLGGQEHDRDVSGSVAAPDLLQKLDAVDVRQEHIKDDHVEHVVLDRPAGLGARRAERGKKAGRLERLLQVHPDRQAIVDDERARAHSCLQGESPAPSAAMAGAN